MTNFLKIALLGSYLGKTGPVWATPKIKLNFFVEITKEIMNFQELFILSKYHKFWLSYEWFSVLCDILLPFPFPTETDVSYSVIAKV